MGCLHREHDPQACLRRAEWGAGRDDFVPCAAASTAVRRLQPATILRSAFSYRLHLHCGLTLPRFCGFHRAFKLLRNTLVALLLHARRGALTAAPGRGAVPLSFLPPSPVCVSRSGTPAARSAAFGCGAGIGVGMGYSDCKYVFDVIAKDTK